MRLQALDSSVFLKTHGGLHLGSPKETPRNPYGIHGIPVLKHPTITMFSVCKWKLIVAATGSCCIPSTRALNPKPPLKEASDMGQNQGQERTTALRARLRQLDLLDHRDLGKSVGQSSLEWVVLW